MPDNFATRGVVSSIPSSMFNLGYVVPSCFGHCCNAPRMFVKIVDQSRSRGTVLT